MFKNYKKIKLSLRNRGTYNLWVADSFEKKKKGLKGVKGLPRKHGMIFVYSDLVNNRYTMAGVKIPLNFLFLDQNFNIVDTIRAFPGQINIESKKPYKYVIEISD